jgi:hypothetical protein
VPVRVERSRLSMAVGVSTPIMPVHPGARSCQHRVSRKSRCAARWAAQAHLAIYALPIRRRIAMLALGALFSSFNSPGRPSF